LNGERFLTGRTALVTGAGRGIGLAVAKELAELGARVLLVGRTAERLQALEAEIHNAGNQAIAMPADVCDKGWLDSLKTDRHGVDILVHGAAEFAPYGPLEQRSDEEISAVINTNLVAALQLAAALLPGMKKRNHGMLLFLGSKAASLGAKNQVIYAAAKAGLAGLVKSLVVENAFSGVNAHLLELGLIDTERTREAMSEHAKAQLCSRSPAGRPGTPEEVAAAVRYLLSPQATFLRGITLPLAGGIGLGVFMPSPPDRHSLSSEE
jgi:NAD(P)-dependent dehydrogenase (short-subunit alcohol dehydrogenase family)